MEDIDLDEDLDALIQPEEGYSRVYAVPRSFQCTSEQFMHIINYFGHEGGFEEIIDILENGEMDETLNIQVMGNLATLISLPANIYHRTFMDEFGARISNAIKARLLGASDKSIRDVRKE